MPEEPGAPECLRTEDCDDGQVCTAEMTCVPAEGSICGLPPAEDGQVDHKSRCSETEQCVSGKVCRWSRLLWGADDASHGFGHCLQACDPCVPSCAAGQWCLPLAQGGGACIDDALEHREGFGCRAWSTLMDGPSRACAHPFACRRLSADADHGICIRACRPDDDALRTGVLVDPSAASSSPDCGPDSVCHALDFDSVSTDVYRLFACEPGALLASGASCPGAGTSYCRAPEVCVSGTCQ